MNQPVPAWHRRHLLGCLAAVGLFLAPAALAGATGTAVMAWPGGNVYQRSVRNYAVPDVTLTDADARPVRLRELLAGADPVMLNFIFTTCNAVCPVMVRVFADVPARLGESARKLRLVSVSIDPENDTPSQLKTYARQVGAGAQWTMLTGRLQDITTVQRAFDGYRGDKMNHEPLTLMRSASGRSWIRIDGFANPDELVREFNRGALQ